ncbi:MAG: hypothetical protein FJY97_06165 [candidate division Zixibacteria bacterium]|nr:hypothetical protein [candidate division Zixibacteria bacterium]
MKRMLYGALCVWVFSTGTIRAQEAQTDSLAELGRRLAILADEIERLKLGRAAVAADASVYGLGPAASKVYRNDYGISIGGYGEMVYTNFAKKRDNGAVANMVDRMDMLHAILYVGYKFDDRWLLNTEFEFEHGSTGSGGEVSAEFVHLEYLHRPAFNLRFGLLLIPMGFVNEMHEPTVFMGVDRPDVERVIIPSTWRENGAGVFGEIGPLAYRTYVVNGLKAEGFTAKGLRGGRQKGAIAKADHFAWTGRVDLTPLPGITVGGSGYAGYSGQDKKAGTRSLNVPTVIFEGHVDVRYRGLWFSALGARASVGEAALLNQSLELIGDQRIKSVGKTLAGFYLQAGYDALSATRYNHRTLMPYVRYESYNTQHSVPTGFVQDPSKKVTNLTFGVAFQPESRIVFKFDYKNIDNKAKTGLNQLNAGAGYIF